MSSLNISRRSALGFLGAGSAAVALAACSGANNTGGSGSSASGGQDQKDYSGEVKFDNYDTSAGKYEPGTKEQPPKNFPKPLKPEQMGEKSVAGFYAAIGYMVASWQYFNNANDPAPFMEVALDPQGNKLPADQVQQAVEERKKQKTWAEDHKLTAILDSPQPKTDGDTYTWNGKMKATNGSFVVIGGQAMDIPEEQRTEEVPAVFKGIYKDGTWWLSYPQQNSGGSSDAQGGSQNQQQGQNQGQTPQQQAPQEGAGEGASGNGGAQ